MGQSVTFCGSMRLLVAADEMENVWMFELWSCFIFLFRFFLSSWFSLRPFRLLISGLFVTSAWSTIEKWYNIRLIQARMQIRGIVVPLTYM